MFKAYAYYVTYDRYGDKYQDYDTFHGQTKEEIEETIKHLDKQFYYRIETTEVKQ